MYIFRAANYDYGMVLQLTFLELNEEMNMTRYENRYYASFTPPIMETIRLKTN